MNSVPVNLWFMQQVNLVLHENHWHMSTLVFHFSFPLFDGFKGGMVGGGKSNDTGLSSSVVGLGDGIKFLLARSVPKHESHIFTTCPKKEKKDIYWKNLAAKFSSIWDHSQPRNTLDSTLHFNDALIRALFNSSNHLRMSLFHSSSEHV